MYGDSQALSSSDDSMPPILPFPSNPSKPKQERTEQQLQQFDLLMESDIANNNNNNNNSNNNSGLLRFRSAPTCLLANFADEKRLGASDSGFCSDEAINNTCNKDSGCNNRALPVLMNSQLPPQYPRQSGVGGGGGQLGGVGGGGGGGGYGVGQSKLGLMRQNSSPPGFLTPQNGYTSVIGMGSYRMAEDSGDGDISPSSGRLQSRMNLSSSGVIPSSLRMLSRITEVEMEHGGLDYSKVGNGISGDNLFSGSSGFPFGSWNDSSYLAETFSTSTGIKKEMDNDPNLFLNSENGETINNRPYALSHHLSLPKTPAEMANMEKYIQDAVPCKIRAKRGCATHPRSIAERVRRTRISERMRKLQDLVPNMDKQTNTADMLDLAVEYIKNLQKQYKILSDNRANCKCSASKKVI